MRILPHLAWSMLLLQSAPLAAQEVPSLQRFCAEIGGRGIGLAELSGADTRRLRLDLVLESIRLCPEEFMSVANLFPPPQSPISAIRQMLDSTDQPAVALARDAAGRIQTSARRAEISVARELAAVLGQPQTANPRDLAEVDRRDSEDLARLAAAEQNRAGEHQHVLLDGIFIMWIANRSALNAAFESLPSSQDWLRPFPPSIVMVGGVTKGDFSDLERAVVSRAEASDGPVDKWFRRFTIEQ
jgi:hypothetical protein